MMEASWNKGLIIYANLALKTARNMHQKSKVVTFFFCFRIKWLFGVDKLQFYWNLGDAQWHVKVLSDKQTCGSYQLQCQYKVNPLLRSSISLFPLYSQVCDLAQCTYHDALCLQMCFLVVLHNDMGKSSIRAWIKIWSGKKKHPALRKFIIILICLFYLGWKCLHFHPRFYGHLEN